DRGAGSGAGGPAAQPALDQRDGRRQAGGGPGAGPVRQLGGPGPAGRAVVGDPCAAGRFGRDGRLLHGAGRRVRRRAGVAAPGWRPPAGKAVKRRSSCFSATEKEQQGKIAQRNGKLPCGKMQNLIQYKRELCAAKASGRPAEPMLELFSAKLFFL